MDKLLIEQYQLLNSIEHLYERFAAKQAAFKTLGCAQVQVERLNLYLANFKAAHRNILLFQSAHPEHSYFSSNVLIKAEKHYLNNLDNFNTFIIQLESRKKAYVASTLNASPSLHGEVSATSQRVDEDQQTHCELQAKLSQPLCSGHSDTLQEGATSTQCELNTIKLHSDSTQSFSYQISIASLVDHDQHSCQAKSLLTSFGNTGRAWPFNFFRNFTLWWHSEKKYCHALTAATLKCDYHLSLSMS